MKTAQLSAERFNSLLEGAEIWNFSSTEIAVSNIAEEDEFFFYYDITTDTITDKGSINLSEDQEESIKELAFENHKEEIVNEPFDGYKEYALDPNMFLKV